MSSKTNCIIENCDQTCSPRSQFNICVRCRGRIGYALLQGTGWIMKRKGKLALYTDRMQYLTYRGNRHGR